MDPCPPEIVVEHGRESATVSFVAPVSEANVIGLVRIVNELRRQRFYRRVELQIASPGGEVLALLHFLEALGQREDEGLELATRALTDSRPLASLRPGECCASFPDGRFERLQLDPYAPSHHHGQAGSSTAAVSTAPR